MNITERIDAVKDLIKKREDIDRQPRRIIQRGQCVDKEAHVLTLWIRFSHGAHVPGQGQNKITTSPDITIPTPTSDIVHGC